MNTNYIYRKTALGAQEIQGRKIALKPAARRTLILVDGIKSIDAMMPLFREPKDVEEVLAELVQLGLIEIVTGATHAEPATLDDISTEPAPIENRSDDANTTRNPVQRFMDGQKFMNNAIRENLGQIKAVFFTLKIEQCNNVDDCLALLDEYQAALAKAMKDDAGAASLRRKTARILRP